MQKTRLPIGHYDDKPIILAVKLPGSINLDPQTTCEFEWFMQNMAYRRAQGAMRYGDKPQSKQKYLTRLRMELRSYIKTGNIEHLYNIANYAFLESIAPQHQNSHFDPNAKSATREKLGGNIA